MLVISETTNTSDSENELDRDIIYISDEAAFVYMWVVCGVMCQIINIFGITTNAINIICFVKQGYKESVNVSLLGMFLEPVLKEGNITILIGLSISDMGCLLTQMLTCLCITPAVSTADLTFEPLEVNYLINIMPHLTFSRISSWITAIITTERCLCVAAPLKIKTVVTPRRMAMVTACVFIVSFCCTSPVYAVNRLDTKFSLYRNKTIFGLVYMDNKEPVEKIYFIINNFITPFFAFMIIVISTITLVFKLKTTSKWRQQFTNTSHVDNVSNRNEKVAKMVIMISILFIVCFIPLSVSVLALACEPELTFSGRYAKLGMILGGIVFSLESINSSVNVFIYYNMSSKFRHVCDEIICNGEISKVQ